MRTQCATRGKRGAGRAETPDGLVTSRKSYVVTREGGAHRCVATNIGAGQPRVAAAVEGARNRAIPARKRPGDGSIDAGPRKGATVMTARARNCLVEPTRTAERVRATRAERSRPRRATAHAA